MWIIFCVIVLFVFVRALDISLTSSETNKWFVSSCDQKVVKRINASVPGFVHLDLVEANTLMVENLYFRFNEANISWVTKNCFSYEISVPFPHRIDWDHQTYLKLEGVDTVADIFVNELLIGTCENSFRSHIILLNPKYYHQYKKEFKIRIDIQSSYLEARNKATLYPYDVPHTENYNVWAERTNRNFLRKTASDFGWDWGPAYIPAGLGNIKLFQSPTGKLDGIIVLQTNTTFIAEREYANTMIEIKLRLIAIEKPMIALTEVYLANELLSWQFITITPSSLSEPEEEPTCIISIGKFPWLHAKVWWPRGFGEQHLHEMEVRYYGIHEHKNQDLKDYKHHEIVSKYTYQSIRKYIGIRTVELVDYPNKRTYRNTTTNQLKEKSRTAPFFFLINKEPIFMKGANIVPLDSFRSRVTESDIEYMLHSAAEANFNMLRVWGGGHYQTDYFYDLADKLGLLIWQEMMFACSLYPRDDGFLGEVHKEVVEQVTRLATHASIVVWGGNNENEVALNWFAASKANRDLYVADYVKLYADTIYPALLLVDGIDVGESEMEAPPPSGSSRRGAGGRKRLQRAWVDSSPSNGLVSLDPYVKRWGDGGSAEEGDMHYYDYYCDCENPESYPVAQFISEFGFQSNPSFLTYQAVTTAEDWSPDSPLMKFRQRHENGNAQMINQITKHFLMPTDRLTCDRRRSNQSGVNGKTSRSEPPIDSQSIKYFDNYLYLTGIQQSRCYEVAVNKWRQSRLIPVTASTTSSTTAADGKDQSEPRTSSIPSLSDKGTMGVLYWQLNDVWQGPSWSSIEWGGRWKPLHYSMKRAFAPVTVTFSGLQDTYDSSSPSRSIGVFVVNDLPSWYPALDLIIQVYLMPWEPPAASRRTVLWSGEVTVSSGAATKVVDIELPNDDLKFTRKYGTRCTSATCYLKAVTEVAAKRNIIGSRKLYSSGFYKVVYVDDTSTSSVPDPPHSPFPRTHIDIDHSYFFLTPMKMAKLGVDTNINLFDFKLLLKSESETRGIIFQFSLSVNQTAPFLFLELEDEEEDRSINNSNSNNNVNGAKTTATIPSSIKRSDIEERASHRRTESKGNGNGKGIYEGDIAGWFDKNNLLAEANEVYQLRYSVFRKADAIMDEEEVLKSFRRRLRVRSLQDVYSCEEDR